MFFNVKFIPLLIPKTSIELLCQNCVSELSTLSAFVNVRYDCHWTNNYKLMVLWKRKTQVPSEWARGACAVWGRTEFIAGGSLHPSKLSRSRMWSNEGQKTYEAGFQQLKHGFEGPGVVDHFSSALDAKTMRGGLPLYRTEGWLLPLWALISVIQLCFTSLASMTREVSDFPISN